MARLLDYGTYQKWVGQVYASGHHLSVADLSGLVYLRMLFRQPRLLGGDLHWCKVLPTDLRRMEDGIAVQWTTPYMMSAEHAYATRNADVSRLLMVTNRFQSRKNPL